MRRILVGACVTVAAAMSGAVALAHSVQNPNLPDGRFQLKNGYVDVEYNKKIKKIDFIQVYYPCRAAGDSKSKYPAFIGLDTNPHAALVGDKSAGTFTKRITEATDPKAFGDTATVRWAVRAIRFSAKGLSGDLNLTVTGPRTICPFTLTNKLLVPLLDIPGNS